MKCAFEFKNRASDFKNMNAESLQRTYYSCAA